MNATIALCGAVDEELTHYEVDVENASLQRRATVKVAANVQYAWPHPSRRFLQVATSNRGPRLEPQAAFVRDLLADRAHVKPRQLAGTVHVHPSGKFVYFANRTDWTTDYSGRPVFNGGENSIAVFAIDQHSGEPALRWRNAHAVDTIGLRH